MSPIYLPIKENKCVQPSPFPFLEEGRGHGHLHLFSEGWGAR